MIKGLLFVLIHKVVDLSDNQIALLQTIIDSLVIIHGDVCCYGFLGDCPLILYSDTGI